MILFNFFLKIKETIMNWYLLTLKKYAVFTGRSGRKEYWMFFLFNMIFSFIAGFTDGILTGHAGFISTIYVLGTIVPTIAAAIRRLHDTGKSGRYMLLVFIPFVGSFILLFLLTFESDSGDNKYGSFTKTL